MSRYTTLAQAASTEIIILNSRFIALGQEVATVEAAEAFLKEVRQRYPDATHHCYAFKVQGPPVVDRFSDDGEPGGTAGRPILTVLEHRVTNAIAVIVRYYGGTKLGTGGLVKAYTQATQALLEAAGLAEREPLRQFKLNLPYSLLSTLEHHLRSLNLSLQTTYGAEIEATLDVPESLVTNLEATLDGWFAQGLRWQAVTE
jgi:uncharacterized YigZ family protein